MTGLDADLATLREFLDAVEPTGNVELIYTSALPRVVPARAALARVEAELSRLREERDAAYRNSGNVAIVRLLRRALAAEARCARLQQALDRAITTLEYVGGADLIVQELREVSEASGTGSSAAGSGESPMPEGERQGRQPVPEESREALTGPDTPADSPKHADSQPEEPTT